MTRSDNTIYLRGSDKPYCRIRRSDVGLTIDVQDVHAKKAGRLLFTKAGAMQLASIIQRLLQPDEKGDAWRSVRDYGAKGDNQADDAPAIQTAVDDFH